MTEGQRKQALSRVNKIASDVRALSAYDLGVSTPPDWRPFVAELADEVAKILEQLAPRRRRTTVPSPRKPRAPR